MKNIEYIKEYYNKYYTDKLDSLFKNTLIIQAFKPYENDVKQGKWLSKQMDIKGDEKILECGCGIGGVIKQLATLHPEANIKGINISDGQLEIAKDILKDLDNCSVSVQDFMNTDYKKETFDLVYFCESLGYGNFDKAIKESIRILKPGGRLYINETVIKCPKYKLSMNELNKLNKFIESWFYEAFDIDTIVEKVENIGGLKLVNKNKFAKPSMNWINAVRNSDLKKYHNASLFNIPPLRGADFLYKKVLE